MLMVIALFLGSSINAQNTATTEADKWQYAIPAGLCDAITNGNAMLISSYLNNTVEISMPQGNSNVYSRKQAEMVLTEYFTTIGNAKFEIGHERSMPPSTMTIGKLTGGNAHHRISILTQKHGDDILIHQMRIEEDK